MTYAEKLKDPRWQKKRLEILERDMWACRRCSGGQKTLHVHHVNYMKGKQPWQCPAENLITLCEDCHNHIEQKIVAARREIIRQECSVARITIKTVRVTETQFSRHPLSPQEAKAEFTRLKAKLGML